MKKLAFAVRDLGSSQLSYYLIRSANAYLSHACDIDIVAFFELPALPSLPMLFASMQHAEAWAYDGVVISTSLSTAEKFLKFPCAKQRYFYVWDLEWVRMGTFSHEEVRRIYCNPNHKLVARSNEHAYEIARCWNVETPIVIEDSQLVQGFVNLIK